MQKKSLVVIDIQNDITKNYKEIIDNVNRAIDWAVENEIHVVYIRHYNLSDESVLKEILVNDFGKYSIQTEKIIKVIREILIEN